MDIIALKLCAIVDMKYEINMQKLLKSTLVLVVFLITLSTQKSTITPAIAIDGNSSDADPFSLGVSLDGDKAVVDFGTIKPDDKINLASQTVHVAVGFHMDYDLSLETINNGTRLIGKGGAFINSTPSGDELKSNSWGFREDKSDSKWLGLPANCQKQLIAGRDNAGEPQSDEITVQYGVRANALTKSDSYENAVRYSVTARELTTPAVRSISQNRLVLGERQSLEITGAGLDRVEIGVDINKNGSLNSAEGCEKIDSAANDKNHLYCQIEMDDGNLIDTQETFNVLMRYQSDEGKDVVAPTGQTITYYHKPRLDSLNLGHGAVTTAELKTYPKVKIRAIDTAGTSAVILGTDGTVWQDGRKILYDGGPSDDANLSTRPSVTIEPWSDGVVSVAAGVTSNGKPTFFAIDRGGAIYDWGDNTDKRLLIDGGDYVGLPTKANYHASVGGRPRQIAVGGDFYTLIGEASDRDSCKLGLYSWGNGEHDALGIEGYEGKTLWNKDGQAPKQMTRDNIKNDLEVDDYFTKVVAGDKHGLALTKNGQIVSWGAWGDGNDVDGRLAWKTKSDANQIHNITRDGEADSKHYFTGDVEPLFVDVAAGDNFTIILDSTGLVYTFGRNDYGQLGRTTTGEETKTTGLMPSFGDVLNGDKLIGISAKEHMALAWSKNGQLFTWGLAYTSNLPGATRVRVDEPRIIQGGKVKLAAAGENIYAVASSDNDNDKVYRWSKNGREDITSGLHHPIYNARLTGANLNHIGNIWIDYDGDGEFDSDEESSIMARIENDSTSNDIQLSTDNAPTGGGEYNLCADNGVGDVSCDGVKIRISVARQAEIKPISETVRSSSAKEVSDRGGEEEDEIVEPEGDLEDKDNDTVNANNNESVQNGVDNSADGGGSKSAADEANTIGDAGDNENKTGHEDVTPTTAPIKGGDDALPKVETDGPGVLDEAPISDKAVSLRDAGLTSRRQNAIMLAP